MEDAPLCQLEAMLLDRQSLHGSIVRRDREAAPPVDSAGSARPGDEVDQVILDYLSVEIDGLVFQKTRNFVRKPVRTVGINAQLCR